MPAKVKDSLALKGFDVKAPVPRMLDEDVAKLAKSEGRVLVTFDRHFANTLLFPPAEYAGIVFIRVSPPLIRAVLDALLNLFGTVDEFEGKLFVLSETGFRLFPKRTPK